MNESYAKSNENLNKRILNVKRKRFQTNEQCMQIYLYIFAREKKTEAVNCNRFKIKNNMQRWALNSFFSCQMKEGWEVERWHNK